MKEIKGVMIAKRLRPKKEGNLILTHIARPCHDFINNSEIIKNLFPNGVPDESCTVLDLNLGKPVETKAKKVETKEGETFKLSGLLNDLQKKDDWFYAIDDMTKEYYEKFQKLPNSTEAWSVLCSNPPRNYGITKGTHLKEDCVFMNESNLLSKSAFKKRWKNYIS
jgi:hypothetical protein